MDLWNYVLAKGLQEWLSLGCVKKTENRTSRWLGTVDCSADTEFVMKESIDHLEKQIKAGKYKPREDGSKRAWGCKVVRNKAHDLCTQITLRQASIVALDIEDLSSGVKDDHPARYADMIDDEFRNKVIAEMKPPFGRIYERSLELAVPGARNTERTLRLEFHLNKGARMITSRARMQVVDCFVRCQETPEDLHFLVIAYWAKISRPKDPRYFVENRQHITALVTRFANEVGKAPRLLDRASVFVRPNNRNFECFREVNYTTVNFVLRAVNTAYVRSLPTRLVMKPEGGPDAR